MYQLTSSPRKLRTFMADQLRRYPPKYNFQSTIISPLNKENLKRKLSQTSPTGPDCKWKQRSIIDFLDMAAKKFKFQSPEVIVSATPTPPLLPAINNDEKLSILDNNPINNKDNDNSLIINVDLNYSDCESSTSSSVISNIKRLNQLVAEQQIIANKSPKSTKTNAQIQEYTVEKILKINEIDEKPFFYVKWKGYKECDNTWEPLKNLDDCTILKTFLRAKTNFYAKEIEKIGNTIKNDDNDNTKSYTDTEAFKLIENFNELQLQSDLILMAILNENQQTTSSTYNNIFQRTKHNLHLFPYYLKRMEQLTSMQQWQQQINNADKSSNLMVENNYDFEMPPLDFNYINDNIAGNGIIIPNDPLIGCDCGDTCYSRTKCCGQNSGSLFAYNKKKRIKVPPGTPIFECNDRCKCGPTCMNRVVQQGRKHTLTIYKTNNDRGWGVRTERIIYDGQFICEYVGEIITYEETEKRGKIYDIEGRTYLFDLDINRSDNPYTIDAAKYGNVSHFINHSCDPNCGVWAVWINCLDLDLPKICLFALRRIEAGEELSFDYLNHRANDSGGAGGSGSNNKSLESLTNESTTTTTTDDKTESVDNVKYAMKCKCNSSKCRKFIF